MLAAVLLLDLLECNLSIMWLQDAFALPDLHVFKRIKLELNDLEGQFITLVTAS